MENLNENKIPIRKITVTRQKRFCGMLCTFFIIMDGVTVAKIKSGKTVSFFASYDKHELCVYAFLPARELYSNVVKINEDGLDVSFYLKNGISAWTGKGELILTQIHKDISTTQ